MIPSSLSVDSFEHTFTRLAMTELVPRSTDRLPALPPLAEAPSPKAGPTTGLPFSKLCGLPEAVAVTAAPLPSPAKVEVGPDSVIGKNIMLSGLRDGSDSDDE